MSSPVLISSRKHVYRKAQFVGMGFRSATTIGTFVEEAVGVTMGESVGRSVGFVDDDSTGVDGIAAVASTAGELEGDKNGDAVESTDGRNDLGGDEEEPTGVSEPDGLDDEPEVVVAIILGAAAVGTAVVPAMVGAGVGLDGCAKVTANGEEALSG
jgi:hypothetical protein